MRPFFDVYMDGERQGGVWLRFLAFGFSDIRDKESSLWYAGVGK